MLKKIVNNIVNKNKIFRSMNLYFFDSEEISATDAAYFYGFFVFCGFAFALVMMIYFMNL